MRLLDPALLLRRGDRPVVDHPVLIPTSEGPVGGVVSEPEREPRAALLFLPGYGAPARSGINSFWTRTARQLAQRGVLVLRTDHAREGETFPLGIDRPDVRSFKAEFDLRLIRQVIRWLRARTDPTPLLLAGICGGARAAIEMGGEEPGAFAATLLVVPPVNVLLGARRADLELSRQHGEPLVASGPSAVERAAAEDPEAVDPALLNKLRSLLAHRSSWLLIGERDTITHLPQLLDRLGPTEHPLEVEVVPGMALHLVDEPRSQAEVRSRLLVRVERVLAGMASA